MAENTEPQHTCLHEYDFGTIAQTFKSIEKSLTIIWRFIFVILIIFGGGIVTAVASAILKQP